MTHNVHSSGPGHRANSSTSTHGTTNKNPVAQKSPEYVAMSGNWALVNTLWGGTDAMRHSGRKYLPQMPDEPESAYRARLRQSVLTNIYRDTIEKLVSKPLKQPVTLKDDVPEAIQSYRGNIDGQATDIDVFTKQVGESALNHGLTYILVDYPQVDPETTVLEERQQEIRPYAIHYNATQVIGWKSEVVNGRRILTQVRIYEKSYEDVSEFEQRAVERIRVLEPGFYRTYELRMVGDNQQDWVLAESHEVIAGGKVLDFIPLVTVYSNKRNFMVGAPAMLDVAHLNITHWQSDSDQRNILHVARVPILFGSGLGDEDSVVKLSVGSTTFIRGQISSDLKYVEHSGKGIEAGARDLEVLVERMSSLGLNMLVRRSPGSQGSRETATGRSLDQAEADSPLSMFARELENSLEEMLDYFGIFLGMGDDAGGSVELFKDFTLTQRDVDDIKELGQMRTRGDLSQLTYWEELKRRNLLSDNFDSETEIDLLDLESPGDRPGITEAELEQGNMIGDETGETDGHVHVLQANGFTNIVRGHKHKWEVTGTETSEVAGHSHRLGEFSEEREESELPDDDNLTDDAE